MNESSTRASGKSEVRGLRIGNKCFFARLAIPDPDSGEKQVRRVPLWATSVAPATAELRKLLTQRVENELPSVKRAPKSRDFVEE